MFAQFTYHSNMRYYLIAFALFLASANTQAQNLFSTEKFTRQDSLRGSITKEREWWDLQRYELSVAVNIPDQSIKGTNVIHYKVLNGANVLQIDLQSPMSLDKATQ